MEKIKAQLPEMLAEIESCREEERNYQWLYRYLVFECLKETVDPNYDAGVWTTEEVVEAVYNKYARASNRRRFLEWVVKNIRYLAKNT